MLLITPSSLPVVEPVQYYRSSPVSDCHSPDSFLRCKADNTFFLESNSLEPPEPDLWRFLEFRPQAKFLKIELPKGIKKLQSDNYWKGAVQVVCSMCVCLSLHPLGWVHSLWRFLGPKFFFSRILTKTYWEEIHEIYLKYMRDVT